MPAELVTKLLNTADVRIERFISHGHASAADFWYNLPQSQGLAARELLSDLIDCQPDGPFFRPEGMIVLKVAARLQFDGGVVRKVGDFINIPTFNEHRVDGTTPDEPTMGLGVRYGNADEDRLLPSRPDAEHVGTADGKAIPEAWILVPPGDAALTRSTAPSTRRPKSAGMKIEGLAESPKPPV